MTFNNNSDIFYLFFYGQRLMAKVECELREGTTSQELEQQRRILVEAREIKPSRRQALNYFLLLTDLENAPHFTGVPETFEEFMSGFRNPRVHVLAGIKALGEKIGYATITDAGIRQHDHAINHLVVSNELQSRNANSPTRVGTQFLSKIIEWGFTKPMHDGGERTKLYISVVEDVPNWERAERTVLRCGFKHYATLPEQSDVLLNGELVTKPSRRFELLRSDWEKRAILKPN